MHDFQDILPLLCVGFEVKRQGNQAKLSQYL